MSILAVEKLTKQFGGLTAVSEIDLAIQKNELVGLIGPNGAGKTTFFNLLTGVYKPTEGKITMNVDGKSVSLVGKRTDQIAAAGVARTFQNIRLFKQLTVLDNVLIGLHKKNNIGTIRSILRFPSFFKMEDRLRKEALELLAIFDLEDSADVLAENLPYGKQRRLEIVRALATKPALLFLDEPAAGMNPQESAELTQLIKKIQMEFDLTVILIEHDMSVVMNVCERIYVLEYGRLLAEGTPEEIRSNPDVLRAYLGEEH
ncbi:ABC transporter ATP-binding protein [Marinilactibacillus piezotolerans]|uniref:ABC transporter ATP-binding protein n=1 Tax=Marinilactibacillus piezotolerans TaxID=258723 RepID=UPI0009B17D41|nr:ABC transporter ATP-binding protein [Marinilactibacillus piezotolerans]